MFDRRHAANKNCDTVVHTYSYIWPKGKPFKLRPFKAGPWVHPFLKQIGLPDVHDQRVVTNWLLDQFALLLQELASQFPRVRVMNSLGALTRSTQWNDEIHPKPAGFRKLARDYWIPVLQVPLA